MRVVADHREAAACGLQGEQNAGLQTVRVLVFVDKDMIEAAAYIVGDVGVGNHLRHVEKEIVVIGNVVPRRTLRRAP